MVALTRAVSSADVCGVKALLLIALLWFSWINAGLAQIEKQFGSILVRSEGRPTRNISLIDFDANFAWLGRHFGDQRDFGGNTKPGVFVYSKSHEVWLQIVNVSTAGAKFGKSSANLQIAAPWDFSELAKHPSVALPIPTAGAIHLPDKARLDESRDAFVLSFDSDSKDELQTTTLLVPRKDLLAAFEHYKRPR